MSFVITDGDIEFLDSTSAPEATREESIVTPVVTTAPIVRWFVLVVLLVGGGWLIASTGPDPVLDQPAGDTIPAEEPSLTEETTAQPSVDGPAIAAPVFDAWPSPPRERNPNVALTPGPAQVPEELSAFSFRSTTIVFVNTAGRPTVVSFESGDVSEVDVAATRVHETFAVLAGLVVPLDGPDAEQAIVFHTYRDVDRPGVGTMSDQRGVGFGPQLCLSGETCARPGLGLERVRQGGLLAERFDPLRHPALDDLITSWNRSDGDLLSPGGYRIPQPVGLIWVIAPTTGGSVSSSGLL